MTGRAVAVVIGLAVLLPACAELTGSLSSDLGLTTSGGSGKYLTSEPTSAALAAGAVAIPPGAMRYRRFLMQAWEYHFGLAEDPAIGFGQVHQESRFDCSATSAGGSAGCAQFTPDTAQWISSKIPEPVRSQCPKRSGCPMDPQWALTALVEYDWRLWGDAKAAANDRERWGFALSAYNGGAGWSSAESKACGSSQGCDPAVIVRRENLDDLFALDVG